jgi:hypothetical protein
VASDLIIPPIPEGNHWTCIQIYVVWPSDTKFGVSAGEGRRRNCCANFGAPRADQLDGMYLSSRTDPIWEEWEEYGCSDHESEAGLRILPEW